jgi:Ca2+-binding RTX toxin-like protein
MGDSNILSGGDGIDWVGLGGNSNQLFGGAGDDWLGATGNSNLLLGDTSNNSLLAIGNSNLLYGGDGSDWVGVGGNNNRLLGGTGDDYLATGGSGNTLDGGPGNDHLVAGAGNQNATFLFQAGYGQDDITGFSAHAVGGTDILDIEGFGLATFGQLQPYMKQSGSDVVITLGSDILTVHNVQLGGLQASDFHLV